MLLLSRKEAVFNSYVLFLQLKDEAVKSSLDTDKKTTRGMFNNSMLDR